MTGLVSTLILLESTPSLLAIVCRYFRIKEILKNEEKTVIIDKFISGIELLDEYYKNYTRRR